MNQILRFLIYFGGIGCVLTYDESDYHLYHYEDDFVVLYEAGVNAYLGNDWETCSELLEKSLSDYRRYYQIITGCRLDCYFKEQHKEPMMSENVDDLHFYEFIVRRALCNKRCQDKLLDLPKFFALDSVEREIFRSRRAYEYLQLCYFKVN